MKWIKASRSTAFGACVELISIPGGVGVRDSKDPRGPVLLFTAEEWAAFLDGAKNGEFDGLAGSVVGAQRGGPGPQEGRTGPPPRR